MPWTNTNSSMIGAYNYDEDVRVLHIRFRNTGQTYSFQGVPPDVAKQLADAPSIGKFFKSNIEGQFHAI
jgi:lysyl-tRNA synthetase class 2